MIGEKEYDAYLNALYHEGGYSEKQIEDMKRAWVIQHITAAQRAAQNALWAYYNDVLNAILESKSKADTRDELQALALAESIVEEQFRIALKGVENA